MKGTEKKVSVVEAVKRTAMRAVVKSAEPKIFGWPWCIGLIHQPKHPMLQQQKDK